MDNRIADDEHFHPADKIFSPFQQILNKLF